MARPAAGYKLADGTRVPGVTTIIGALKDSGGLIHWAWKLGTEGIDYRKVRDDAADAGTLAHDLIEAEIRGLPLPTDPDPEKLRKATNALNRFREWREQTRAEITVHERPMVSEKHRFGGTPDSTLIISQRRGLGDWKSSNGVYGEYLAQLGGYSILIEENEGWTPEEAHLLRFDKECESWTHHYFGPQKLELGRAAFLAALAVHPYREQLRKAAA